MKNEKGIGNRIQLNEVTKFASGTYGRGKRQHFVLWAFGKTGWFEIRPNAKYQTIYDDMIEGVKLFYFLCDQYTVREKQRRPSAKQVFKAFANLPGSPCANVQEAQQLLYKHYYFLIAEMINDTQEIGWDKTPIFKELVNTFPEATQNIRMRMLESSEEGTQETDGDSSAYEAQGTSESPESPTAEPELVPEIQTPKGSQCRKRARPRQSVLRPTSSRPVKSAKSRGKAPALSDAESSASSQEASESEGKDEEDEESEGSQQDDEETERVSDGDHNNSVLDETALSPEHARNVSRDPPFSANGIIEPETKGILTTERLKIVQSEGQRGARVGNLLDFVLNRTGG